MGTRSIIAIEKKDGTYSSSYCHYDGYLEHNGEILKNHYQNPDKVKKLISMGDMTSLGERIGNTPRPYSLFDMCLEDGRVNKELQAIIDTPENQKAFDIMFKKQCNFYHRDQGHELVTNNANNIIDLGFKNSGAEFLYMYKEAEEKWYVATTYYDLRDKKQVSEFREL